MTVATSIRLHSSTITPTSSTSPMSTEEYNTDEEPSTRGGDFYRDRISIDIEYPCWISRAVSRTFLAPLDRVKFVMQTQKELIRNGTLTTEFRSAWECARHLSRIEGKRSFWRGNLIQVVSLVPIALAQALIALPTTNYILNIYSTRSETSYALVKDAADVLGILAACVVSYPLEFARFRLAVDIKAKKGAPYLFRHSLQFFSHPVFTEFTPHLYRGLTIFIFGSFVHLTVQKVLYNLADCYMLGAKNSHMWTAALVMTSITVSGIATLAMYPLDLVRRRLMVAVTSDRLRYPSTISCVTQIAQTEGLRGFYRGSVFALTRIPVAAALWNIGLAL